MGRRRAPPSPEDCLTSGGKEDPFAPRIARRFSGPFFLGDLGDPGARHFQAVTEDGGKTVLTLRGGPINATSTEMKTYVSMFDSMRQGFGGSFDQLDAFLSKH